LLLEVPGDGDGPRASDVALARKVVTRGVKLYGTPVKAAAKKAAPPKSKMK
jgi:hypothetical protein